MAIIKTLDRITDQSEIPTAAAGGDPWAGYPVWVGLEYTLTGANLTKYSIPSRGLEWNAISNNYIIGIPRVFLSGQYLQSFAKYEYSDNPDETEALPTVQIPLIQNTSYTFNALGELDYTIDLDSITAPDEDIDVHYTIYSTNSITTRIQLTPTITRNGYTPGGELLEFTGLPLKEVYLWAEDDFGYSVVASVPYSASLIDGELVIPRSNWLKFFELSEKDDNVYSKTWDCDYEFKNKLYIPYAYPVKKDDLFWIQWQSEFTNHTIELIQPNGTTIDISSGQQSTTSGTVTYIEKDLDFSSLSGLYYIKITTLDTLRNERVFISEWFNVKEEHEYTSLVEWENTNSKYGYQDGLLWTGKTQKMRVDGEIMDFNTGSDRENLEDSNSRLVTLTGYPQEINNFELYKAHKPIIERLNIGINHRTFIINDVEMNKEGGFEVEVYKGSNLYKGQNELRTKNYEIY